MCLFCSQLTKAISNQSDKLSNNQAKSLTNQVSTLPLNDTKNIPNEIKLIQKLYPKKCEKCLKTKCDCEVKNPRTISSCEEDFCRQNIQTNTICLKPKEILVGTSNGLLLNIDLSNCKLISENKIHLKSVNSIVKNNKNMITASSDGFIKIFEKGQFSRCISEYSNNGDPLTSAICIDENQVICGFENKNVVSLFEIDNNLIKINKEFNNNINYPIQSLCRLTNDLVLLGEKDGLNGKILFLNLNKNMVQFGIETGTNCSINSIIKLKYSNVDNFISSGSNGFIKLWDLKAKLIQNHDANSVSKIAEFTDGRIICSNQEFNIKFVDLKSNQICAENFNFHKSTILDFYQFDNYSFCSCSKDNTIALWDSRKNQPVSSFELPKEYYGNVLFKFEDN